MEGSLANIPAAILLEAAANAINHHQQHRQRSSSSSFCSGIGIPTTQHTRASHIFIISLPYIFFCTVGMEYQSVVSCRRKRMNDIITQKPGGRKLGNFFLATPLRYNWLLLLCLLVGKEKRRKRCPHTHPYPPVASLSDISCPSPLQHCSCCLLSLFFLALRERSCIAQGVICFCLFFACLLGDNPFVFFSSPLMFSYC